MAKNPMETYMQGETIGVDTRYTKDEQGVETIKVWINNGAKDEEESADLFGLTVTVDDDGYVIVTDVDGDIIFEEN